MAKLRNLRAYVPGTDNTVGGATSAYDTTADGNSNAILRKINLNVDIATQNELNDAFTTLSNAITATGTEWKAADQQLSNDLRAWAKGEELSGALHTEITAETDRATTAEQAIRDSLSAYALSITVADAYKVAVGDAQEETSSYVYTITQGGTSVGTINIAKDMFVEGASFQGTVLVLSVRGMENPISTDLSGLVDVYTGAETDTATVTIGDDNSISVTVKDYVSKTEVAEVSAAAIDTVVGTNADLSGANTVWGAKKYAEDLVTEKNVDAEGDDAYISATAADNKVTVSATDQLTTAVALANSAIQNVYGEAADEEDSLIIATTSDTDVTLTPSNRLTAAVATANTAIQSIESDGENHTYVTTTVSEKQESDPGYMQTIAVDLRFGELSAGTSGVAKAEEAKAYVDAAVAGKNVSAEGDGLVTASAANNKVTVQATNALCAVVSKVEGTSTTWDAALQTVSALTGTYVSLSASEKVDNNQKLVATVNTHAVSSASVADGDGLAVASDVKAYVDTVSAAIAVTATGDDYVSAWVENGKDIKLAAKDKLTAAVAAVETSANTWNTALQSADITAGSANGTIAVKGTDVAVTGLQSAAYTLSTAYDKAGDAAALQTAVKNAVNDARFATDAADDYTDIDSIIADVLKIRQALGALKALNVTLTPAQA